MADNWLTGVSSYLNYGRISARQYESRLKSVDLKIEWKVDQSMSHVDQSMSHGDVTALQDLLKVVQKLDQRLKTAIASAEALYGVDAATDSHRGLYISDTDLDRLWQRPLGEPLFSSEFISTVSDTSDPCLRLWQLQQWFRLSSFDLALILVSLMPEIDLRYERVYAYLQDDVTRKRPTVDLAFNLLCHSLGDKLAQRQRLCPTAPLITYQLIHLLADPNQPNPPLLSQFLKVDNRIVQFLLGPAELDPQLISFCQLCQTPTPWKTLPIAPALAATLTGLMARGQTTNRPLRLYLQGPQGVGKRRVAAAIATALNTPLLIVNLAQCPQGSLDVPQVLALVEREAYLQSASLYLAGVDALLDQTPNAGVGLETLLQRFSGAMILGGQQPWEQGKGGCSTVRTIEVGLPEAPERRRYWQTVLAGRNLALPESDLFNLADQFQLTPDQIDQSIAVVGDQLEAPESLTVDDLAMAARQQSGQSLAALAQKLNPKYQWADIVLPSDQMVQLQEACYQVHYREQVYRTWGFGEKLSRGKGLAMLFTGPPGTGKTMAAEVIANDLQLDLYRIDLSQVVSKYIGETEKNLDRIFTAAQSANAILLFDEADALFGKRSDVKDAHDRYANIEVGYLLQKMEDYEGITILASNLRQNMDDAFVRRIQMIVEFPFPDEESRHRIWQVTFPPAAPLAEDVDLVVLAREVKLPGGNIKNIALAAAFTAASEGGDIHMEHLIKAAQREHQKLGRRWSLS